MSEVRALVDKTISLLRQGIHVTILDLIPPTKREPHGLHKTIWDEIEESDFSLPADKRLTLASYEAGPQYVAHVDFVAVDDPLPELPLFLRPGIYVHLPLEATYQKAWQAFPAQLKHLLESK